MTDLTEQWKSGELEQGAVTYKALCYKHWRENV